MLYLGSHYISVHPNITYTQLGYEASWGNQTTSPHADQTHSAITNNIVMILSPSVAACIQTAFVHSDAFAN